MNGREFSLLALRKEEAELLLILQELRHRKRTNPSPNLPNQRKSLPNSRALPKPNLIVQHGINTSILPTVELLFRLL